MQLDVQNGHLTIEVIEGEMKFVSNPHAIEQCVYIEQVFDRLSWQHRVYERIDPSENFFAPLKAMNPYSDWFKYLLQRIKSWLLLFVFVTY